MHKGFIRLHAAVHATTSLVTSGYYLRCNAGNLHSSSQAHPEKAAKNSPVGV